MLLYVFLLGLLVGFLTRIVDLKEDENLPVPNRVSLILGFIYGLTITFVFNSWPETTVLLGVFVALILTRKIDAPGHYIGLAGLVFGFIFWGIPEIRWLPVFGFIIAGGIDEFADWYQEKRKLWKPLARLFYLRPFVEVGAFVYSGMTSFWEVWLTIFAFDIAFVVFDKIGKRYTH